MGIDDDLALVAQLHAGRLEAEPLGVGAAPGGVHHLAGLDRAAVLQRDLQVRPALVDGGDLGVAHDVDAALEQLLGEMVAQLLVEAAQDLGRRDRAAWCRRRGR